MKKNILIFGVLMIALMAFSVNAVADGCTNNWTWHDDALGDQNVSAGNVCISAVNYNVDPNATVRCGIWSECVIGSCAPNEYNVGYAGDGTNTCVDTDWKVMGYSWTSSGYRIQVTEHAGACNVTTTGGVAGTPAYSTCSNTYTRNGTQTTGYCNGAGGNATATATLHVTDGNVCVAGANADPNATVRCSTWGDCVEGATSYPTYYVGYAASGTACSDTDWKTASNVISLPTGARVRTTTHAATCSGIGYVPSYAQSDLQPIVTDGLGTAGASVVSWADLIVTLLVLMFIVGVFMKARGMF